MKNLTAKIEESLSAVLPTGLIVVLAAGFIVPVTGESLVSFLIGVMLLILGLAFFTTGVDVSLIPFGEKIGAAVPRTKKLPLIIILPLAVGVIIAVAEPDLKILANQAPVAPASVITGAVAIGVGIMLMMSFLRVVFQIQLRVLLLIIYAAAVLLTASGLVPAGFIPVSFDAGGVTTGPLVVPFIMAMGVGLSSIRGDRAQRDDTFGFVAICSTGPILSIMLLGAYATLTGHAPHAESAPVADETAGMRFVTEIVHKFMAGVPSYAEDVATALLPVIILCVIFGITAFRMQKREWIRAGVGFFMVFIGLLLFFTGVNIGFMPMGNFIGENLAGGPNRMLLLPLGFIIGYFIVAAEPAVVVLKEQVAQITEGEITGALLGRSLAIGVGLSVAFSVFRIFAGFDFVYFVIPMLCVLFTLTFFVPKLYTAIAFDAGGVASGPLTATFLLPFIIGVSQATSGSDIAKDAFGIVSTISLTPVLVIQCLGLYAQYKHAHRHQGFSPNLSLDILKNDRIISADG